MGQVNKKYISPFSREFWLNRGYSIEEADFKRNSMRPIRPEYWIKQGYNKIDANRKAKETKDTNNKKGSKVRASMSKSDQRKYSPRCIEYWIDKGFNSKEAKQKVKQVQRTFTIDKCIEKYGLVDGIAKYKNRQDKWIKTLNNKSKKETNEINLKKNIYNLHNHNSISDLCKFYEEKTKEPLFQNLNDYIKYVENKIFRDHPTWKYMPAKRFIDKKMKITQKRVFEHLDIQYDNHISQLFKSSKYLNQGKFHAYHKMTDIGLLRSSYEIYFYEEFKNKFPNIIMEIDGRYPNSNFRYDFLIRGQYIEISPCYNIYDKIKKTIDKKSKLFNCIILTTIEEIDRFINNYESNG